MCGIYFHVQTLKHGQTSENGQATSKPALAPALRTYLQARGPDACTERCIELNGHRAIVCSTVLSLRGSSIVPQPLFSGEGHFLCWNGEAWRIDGTPVSGNDTDAVFTLLLDAVSLESSAVGFTGETPGHTGDAIIEALTRISGPFAFVFYDELTATLYFGRDSLGRRSLLMKRDERSLILSSIGDGNEGWEEVPAAGVYSYCLTDAEPVQGSEPAAARLRCVTWDSFGIIPNLSHDYDVSHADHEGQIISDDAVLRLSDLLRTSLKLRTVLPRVAPTEQTSILGTTRTGDDLAALQPLKPARLAVLFSGGLDCSVLARIAHDILPIEEPIDLLNVAFENPHVHDVAKLKASNKTPYDVCPDRITARSSVAELRQVCAGRLFRLIEINVPYVEVQQHRQIVIDLMAPHATEMDLSISLALYFASRGAGICFDAGTGAYTDLKTSARVLLSGLGADELFAGYQRHATAFRYDGHAGLLRELELDYRRLGQRNLGRDDRVISHWGREARYPYLDEDLVRWAVQAPVADKCGFGLSVEDLAKLDLDPAKLVLRLLGRAFGLNNIAKEKKRAIQFGARTAKMEGKTTGTASIKSTAT